MALYKVTQEFVVCVEADSMYGALDLAFDAILKDRTIPGTGSGRLIGQRSHVPQAWSNRKPVAAKEHKTCSEMFPMRRTKQGGGVTK